MKSNLNEMFAIYSRKSKYTGKGESVENQIEKCKDYISQKFDIEDESKFLIYEDEGFTGANTNRPDFKRMMKDAKDKKFSAIVCYKLDRISRNMIDLCNLTEELEKLGISFMCATQEFDTSTPTGRAMLRLLGTFAEFERDVIAERIRDNMLELAKTGRWLGGTTPIGYKSKAIEKKTLDGKDKKLFKLDTIEDERVIVELIFKKYKEFKSQTKLETYLIQNNIKTRNDIFFSRFAIKNILVNPVYAKNDIDMYNYFQNKGVEIFADEIEFDGQAGIATYNKTLQKKGKSVQYRDIKDWIVSVRKA